MPWIKKSSGMRDIQCWKMVQRQQLRRQEILIEYFHRNFSRILKKIVCGLLFKIFKSVKCCATLSACFPPGEFFFGANKKQANVIGWRRRQCLSPANQVAFFLCSREQIRRVENRLYVYMHRWHRTYLKYIYAGSFACDLHAGNFYFWILLPRRGIYFLGLCGYHS